MSKFRISFPVLPQELGRAISSVPGLVVRDNVVTAPDNAAWLVQQWASVRGVPHRIDEVSSDGVPLKSIEALVGAGLREWVPEFLTPYQKDGILQMAHRSGHYWWAAGAGKTAGAICWALAHPGRTVIVTRAGVRRSHGREVERLTTHRAFVIEEAKSKSSSEVAKGLPESDAQFAIVGWENLPDVIDTLLAWKPRNIVFDEVHKAKSHKRWTATPTETGQLKFDAKDNIAHAAMRLSRATAYRLATTATPIKDRTRDLWAQLDLVHPDAWGPFYREHAASFTGRYCGAHPGAYGGIDTSGATNLDELWERVSVIVHQVPHSETHRHLPPRRRLVTYVTQDEQCRAEGFTQSYFKRAAAGGHTGLLEARLMEAAGKKRKALLSLVEEAVQVGQKVVIFTGRREDCDRLAEDVQKIAGDARIFSGHGGTAPAIRDQIQQDYMAAPGPAVLVGTGDAWGEGVNLQDTDLALIAMLPYTPGQIVQWEGRFARHGQKRPVLIQYLICENSVDEHVAGILLDKLPAVESVSRDDSLDGFSDALSCADEAEDIIDNLIAKLAGTPNVDD